MDQNQKVQEAFLVDSMSNNLKLSLLGLLFALNLNANEGIVSNIQKSVIENVEKLKDINTSKIKDMTGNAIVSTKNFINTVKDSNKTKQITKSINENYIKSKEYLTSDKNDSITNKIKSISNDILQSINTKYKEVTK